MSVHSDVSHFYQNTPLCQTAAPLGLLSFVLRESFPPAQHLNVIGYYSTVGNKVTEGCAKRRKLRERLLIKIDTDDKTADKMTKSKEK